MAEQEGMAAWTASAGLSAPHRATADERTSPAVADGQGGRDKVAGAAEDVASFISDRRLSTSGRDQDTLRPKQIHFCYRVSSLPRRIHSDSNKEGL